MKLIHSKHAVALLTVALLGTLPLMARAQSGALLVTPQEAVEFEGEAGFNAPPPLRMKAITPSIEILKPDPAAQMKVKAPFPIQVAFKPQSDAAIDPESFKVMYGALKLDITSRITQYVKVTPTGFSLGEAKIPSGKHRLTMQVRDTKDRTAEMELRIEVE